MKKPVPITLTLKPKPVIISLTAVTAIAIGLGIYFFIQYQQAMANDPRAEATRITNHISSVIKLPDEDPTIATVVDKEKLDNPALSARAEDGDKILIFSESGQLILYRDAEKKVVDLMTIQTETEDIEGTR